MGSFSSRASQEPLSTPTATPTTAATPHKYRKYSSVHVDQPYIALTFDDGPSKTLTPKLLDILKEHGIKATFFVVGKNAKLHPEILKRATDEGNEIGNHSWDHANLVKLSHEQMRQEIEDTSEVIEEATGKKPLLMRPPYGATKPYITQEIVEEYNMEPILWSVDPEDWKSPGSSVVSARILKGAKPGAIILSHDIKPGTIAAMPATIEALQKQGYIFLTVSELLTKETPCKESPNKELAKRAKHQKKECQKQPVETSTSSPLPETTLENLTTTSDPNGETIETTNTSSSGITSSETTESEQ